MSQKRMIEKVVRDFLRALGNHATDDALFAIMQDVGLELGLELRAEQRGIGGTFVHFVEPAVETAVNDLMLAREVAGEPITRERALEIVRDILGPRLVSRSAKSREANL